MIAGRQRAVGACARGVRDSVPASRPNAAREAHAATRRASGAGRAQRAEGERRVAKAGFTLIEIMAVVLILLLIAAVVIPRVSLIASQAALDEAKQLAAALDFTREKAVAVGRVHRLVLDLDHDQYWIEAQPPPVSTPPLLAWADLDELPLEAPRTDARAFAPLRGVPPSALDANVELASVEDDRGEASEGLAQIAFAPDGATLAARVWLRAGDAVHVRVDVAPLADPTRVTIDDATP
jgi:prepilin-type N-terminal cleavage/methylation domain-containing protein